MSPLAFDMARADLLISARPSIDYCARHDIDFGTVAAHAGALLMSPVSYLSHRTFRPDPDGELACWVEAYDVDAETVIDVVAWPPDNPDQFRRLSGAAPALGLAAGMNPATYSMGGALHLHRSPLAWVQNGCSGAVLLDRREGAFWLMSLDTSKIATVDRDHARTLVSDMERLVNRERFVLAEAA